MSFNSCFKDGRTKLECYSGQWLQGHRLGVKQILGGQTLLAGDAEHYQLQLDSVPGVSVLVFGKELLKEDYGSKSYLWNL